MTIEATFIVHVGQETLERQNAIRRTNKLRGWVSVPLSG